MVDCKERWVSATLAQVMQQSFDFGVERYGMAVVVEAVSRQDRHYQKPSKTILASRTKAT